MSGRNLCTTKIDDAVEERRPVVPRIRKTSRTVAARWTAALAGLGLMVFAGNADGDQPRDFVVDRVLPATLVKMDVTDSPDGATLRFFSEKVCVSEHKRRIFDGTSTRIVTVSSDELPCNRRPLAGAQIVIKDFQDAPLHAGITNTDGYLQLDWNDLPLDQLIEGLDRPATVVVQGKKTVDTINLSPAKPYAVRQLTARVKALARADKVNEAREVSRRAIGLGADIAALQAAIEPASSAVQQRHEEGARVEAEKSDHLKRAKTAIKRNDPETATAELDEAERLACRARGVTECTTDDEVTTLRHAVEETPKARRRAKEPEREEQRQGAVAAREERQRQALVEKERRAEQRRLARAPVPLRMAQVLSGKNSPLETALIYSAVYAALPNRPWQTQRAMASIDARTMLDVFRTGTVSMSFKSAGITADDVERYADTVFGPQLFAAVIVERGRSAPMTVAVERLRNQKSSNGSFRGSYSYMRDWTPKDIDTELVKLASAHAAAFGDASEASYSASLEMLRVIVPHLIWYSSTSHP